MASAALAFCSTISTVTPWSRRRFKVENTSWTRLGDRPIDGSSIRISLGSSSSARATSSCFCWPPDSSMALRLLNLRSIGNWSITISMRRRTLAWSGAVMPPSPRLW